MIPLSFGTKIWLVSGITDIRNGFNGRAVKVQTVLKDDPMSATSSSSQSAQTAVVCRRRAAPAGQKTGMRPLRLAVGPRWQRVPEPGAAGNAAGRYRLATAEALADLPDHVVALFILVVAE